MKCEIVKKREIPHIRQIKYMPIKLFKQIKLY